MLRVALFAATNVAVLIVLSIFSRIFGLEQSLGAGNLNGLLIMSAIIGMTGSVISLLMSKSMAKRSVGARVIETPTTPTESWIVRTVERHAREAGIGMPEVAIFDSPTPNAFATGARRDAALVAVSTGLLREMSQGEVEAVIGHEVSHVANGDMVTLTLVQGVVNTFVMFLARIIGHTVDRVVFKTERGYGPAYYIVSIVSQIFLSILASMIVMWFSRRREFRADEGGTKLSGRGTMIAALQRLQTGQPAELPAQLAGFGISGGIGQGLARLFMSHPPLEDRIKALQQA